MTLLEEDDTELWTMRSESTSETKYFTVNQPPLESCTSATSSETLLAEASRATPHNPLSHLPRHNLFALLRTSHHVRYLLQHTSRTDTTSDNRAGEDFEITLQAFVVLLTLCPSQT